MVNYRKVEHYRFFPGTRGPASKGEYGAISTMTLQGIAENGGV